MTRLGGQTRCGDAGDWQACCWCWGWRPELGARPWAPFLLRPPPEGKALQISGALKIREVTRPSTFAARLRLDGDVLTGVATTTIRMTDFGFEPPSILGILKAENEVKLEFHFVARRA